MTDYILYISLIEYQSSMKHCCQYLIDKVNNITPFVPSLKKTYSFDEEKGVANWTVCNCMKTKAGGMAPPFYKKITEWVGLIPGSLEGPGGEP